MLKPDAGAGQGGEQGLAWSKATLLTVWGLNAVNLKLSMLWSSRGSPGMAYPHPDDNQNSSTLSFRTLQKRKRSTW